MHCCLCSCPCRFRDIQYANSSFCFCIMRSAAKKPPPPKPASAAAKTRGKVMPPCKTLTSLAAVELQSIAQFLPLQSILAFGRCNHSLFESLQSPFAFKFTECWIRSTALPPDTEVSLNSPLVRHTPLCLRVIRAWRQPLDPSVCNVLPNPVHQLQSAALGGEPAEWLAFFTHPVMQSLRVLDLGCDDGLMVSQELILAIIALQRLHTLALLPNHESASTFFSMLPLAPALTSLTTRGFRSLTAEPFLAPVARCPLLTSLSLHSPSLAGGFRAFFTAAPLCSQLRELTLTSTASSGPVPDGDYSIEFASLIALTKLTLKQIDVANPMIAGLSMAAALKFLMVEFACWSSIPSQALPDLSVLAAVLAALPALRISLRLVRFVGLFDDPEPAAVADLNALVQRYMQAEQLRPFASRIHVHWASECGLE